MVHTLNAAWSNFDLRNTYQRRSDHIRPGDSLYIYRQLLLPRLYLKILIDRDKGTDNTFLYILRYCASFLNKVHSHPAQRIFSTKPVYNSFSYMSY